MSLKHSREPCDAASPFAEMAKSLPIQRSGMVVAVRELGNEKVEVVYEHAIHEVTRERVAPEVAAQLVLAIIQRDRLVRVVVPSAPPDSGRGSGSL